MERGTERGMVRRRVQLEHERLVPWARDAAGTVRPIPDPKGAADERKGRRDR